MLSSIALCAQAQSAGGGKIVLPLELVAGKPATLAVVMPDGRLQSDVKLILSDGEALTTDESGRAHFLAPSEDGILFAQIEGTGVCAASLVRGIEGSEPLKIYSAPRLAALGGLLRIRGSGFDGDADRNQVALGEQRTLVLAASPAEIQLFLPLEMPPGAVNLQVSTTGQEASAPITMIRAEVTPSNVPPHKKEKIAIRILGTAESLRLELHNIRPDIVRIANSATLLVQTRGGQDNSAVVVAKGLRAGEFSLTARLVPAIDVAGIPDARRFLEAAKKIVPNAESSIFQNILNKLEKGSPNGQAVRKEMRKLLPEGLSGDYGALVQAAHDALFGFE